MPIIRITIQIIVTFLVSYYLSYITLSSTNSGIGEYIFMFLFFVLILFIINHVIKKLIIKKSTVLRVSIKIAITSVMLMLLTLVSCHPSLFPKMQIENELTISALADKNKNSEGMEVWISKITVDSMPYDLSSIHLNEDWKFNSDSNTITAYPNTKHTSINLLLPTGKNIEIEFTKHAWSGLVKIEHQNTDSVLDLYDNNTNATIFHIQGATLKYPPVKSIFLVIGSGFFFFSLYYLLLLLSFLKSNTICLISILLTSVIFKLSGIIPMSSNWILLIFIIHCICSIFVQFFDYKKYLNSILSYIIFILISFFITFSILGQWIFMDDMNTTIAWNQIAVYLMACVWILPLEVAFLVLLEKIEVILHIENKKSVITKKKLNIFILVISFAFSFLLCFSIAEIFPHDYQSTTITIAPADEKNKNSLASEILLSGIIVNGKSYNAPEFHSLPSGWKNENGMIIGSGTTPFILSFEKAKDIKLIFNKHEWSRIVSIQDGDISSTIDLFSNNGIADYMTSYQVQSNKVDNSVSIIHILLFLFLYCITYTLFKYFTDSLIKSKADKNFFVIAFFSLLWIFSLHIVSSYPASMSIDSHTQIMQAMGINPITNAHPAIYTLFIQVTLLLFSSPVAIAIFQACFMSLIMASFINYLNKRGVNHRFLQVFIVLFAFSMNNGIYITIIWKDVPYSICLLWLTLEIYRVTVDKKYITLKSTVLKVVCALSGVYLIRHNGIISYVLVILFLFLLIWIRRKWNYCLPILFSLLLISFIKGPFYQVTNVESNGNIVQNGSGSVALLHGLIYASLYSDNVPQDTINVLEEIMPLKEWSNCYSPYSANALYISEIALKYNVDNKIANLGTSQVLKNYLSVLAKEPYALIKDCLYGLDILWNTFRGNGYNWRVANDSYEIGIVDNELGYYRHDNFLTKITKKITKITFNNKLLDAFFWRAGMHFCIILILFFYAFSRKRWNSLAAFIPCMGNIVSLVLSMAWQDYRYVYFMSLCSGVLLFISVIKEDTSEDFNEDNN